MYVKSLWYRKIVKMEAITIIVIAGAKYKLLYRFELKHNKIWLINIFQV